jgi:hypothetical protein
MPPINLNQVKQKLQSSEDNAAHDLMHLLFGVDEDSDSSSRKRGRLRRVESSRHFESASHDTFQKTNPTFTGRNSHQYADSFHRQNASFTVEIGPDQKLNHANQHSSNVAGQPADAAAKEDEICGLTRSFSAPIPIPNFVSYDRDLDEIESRMKYERATWKMYNRITTHRRNKFYSAQQQNNKYGAGLTARTNYHHQDSSTMGNKTFPTLPEDASTDQHGRRHLVSGDMRSASQKRLDSIIPPHTRRKR